MPQKESPVQRAIRGAVRILACMNRLAARSLSTVSLLVALGACGGAAGARSAPTVANAPAVAPLAATSTAAAPFGPRPIATLLDPGAEPHALLRYRFVAGQRFEWTIDYETNTAIGVSPDAQAPAHPPTHFRMPYRATVENVRADGAAVLFGQFGRPTFLLPAGAPPDLQQTMDAAMVGMDRVTTRMTIDARGDVLEESTDVPSDVAPELAASLRNSAKTASAVGTLLPVEPIGIGGRWVIRQQVQTELVLVDQSFTITLRQLDANGFRLDTAVSQDAPMQRVRAPALPAGTAMWLEKLEGTGSGVNVVGLDGNVHESAVRMTSRMRFRVESDGQTQPLYGVSTANIRIE